MRTENIKAWQELIGTDRNNKGQRAGTGTDMIVKGGGRLWSPKEEAATNSAAALGLVAATLDLFAANLEQDFVRKTFSVTDSQLILT